MKLAILDRDGVINQDRADFIKSTDEWEALPGSLAAIARLTHAGWRVVVASNQSGLARGLFNMQALNAIHAKMRQQLAAEGGQLDAIFLCPHGPNDGCDCRKPKPGMIHDILTRFDADPAHVPVVGDSLRDLQAAHAAGCSPWLVLTGNGQRTRAENPALPEGTQVAACLADVVDRWLAD